MKRHRIVKNAKTKVQTESVSGYDPSKGEMEIDRESWDRLTVEEIRRRLADLGFKKTFNSDGSRMKKADYLRELKNLMK